MRFFNVLIAALVCVLAYNVLFFRMKLGIGLGVLFLFLHVFFFVTRNRVSKYFQLAVGSSVLSVVFAFLYAWRASVVVQLSVLGEAVFFSFVALYFYKSSSVFDFAVERVLLLPFRVVKGLLMSFWGKWRVDEDGWSARIPKGVAWSLVRGIVIAVPVFCVLLFLLVRADPVFEKLTRDFLSQIGERLVVSVILLVGLLAMGLMKLVEHLVEKKEARQVVLGKAHELGVIVGSLVLLLGAFMGVQFRYLFSKVGERGLHDLGIASLTYSEYVRKGFFELLIAAGLVSLVILYVLRYVHRLGGRQKGFIQIVAGLLTVETVFLLLSDLQRLLLYAQAHGLTRARILGFVFLVWLGLLLVVYLWRIWREMRGFVFLVCVWGLSLFSVLAITVVNVDGLIATRYRPTVNGEVDYYYLTALSDDAAASWKPAVLDSEKTIYRLRGVKQLSVDDYRKLFWSERVLAGVDGKVSYLVERYGSAEEILRWYRGDRDRGWVWVRQLRKDRSLAALPEESLSERRWQSFNLSEYLAYLAVKQEIGTFDKIVPLMRETDKLEIRTSDAVKSQVDYDRSLEPPLL